MNQPRGQLMLTFTNYPGNTKQEISALLRTHIFPGLKRLRVRLDSACSQILRRFLKTTNYCVRLAD